MRNKYLSFKKARAYVRKQNLKNTRAWKKWSKGVLKGKEKRPDFIPSNPDVVYKNDGWISWSDWIKEPVEFLPFEEARDYVRSLRLKTQEEWQKYYQGKLPKLQKPKNIPWNPQKIYADKWNGIKDWLGLEWRNFKEAREFVRSLGLKGQIEWRLYCKNELDGYAPKPMDIPTDPQRVYGDSKWIDMSDWLGTNRKRKKNDGEVSETWLSYEYTKKYVHSLKLSSYDEWKAYIENRIENLPQKPLEIPKSPQFVYQNDGWISWSDWLGNDIENNVNEKHIIKDKNQNLKTKETQTSNNFILEYLVNEYKTNPAITKILSLFINDNRYKSIIELNLTEEEVNEAEKILFHFREKPKNLPYSKKAFIGLIFLIYVVGKLEQKISYSTLWKIIIKDLEHYSIFTEHFLNSYFINYKYPNFYLKEAIELACKEFNLRNDFENRDEHQYLRNTILLQIGLLNKSLDNLKLWLSNYNLPIVISELLDKDSQNYSEKFHEGWRVLRRFRDNILSDEQTKNILNQNIWFKHLNLNELLKVSKQKSKKQLMTTQDDDLSIFSLDKIYYLDDGLKFIINAYDLYALDLIGFRYEIYIDNEYKGVLIANDSKELILESPIIVSNPFVNQIDLEVRNEDNDVVYSTEITLFDFNEQLILFDEDGNIYQNIFKKLNPSKKYHILIDSDLDCNFKIDTQREYFDGYATLIPNITYKDDCKITYNNEILFELNFTEYIQKPDFIDQLVIYTKTNHSFILNNEYNFELKVMTINEKTEDIELQDFPIDAKIIKWSYSGGYRDSDEIKNNSTISTILYPEMITTPKHTLLIKYRKRVFKKVLYCNFFEKDNQYRLFQIKKDGTSRLVNRSDCLNKCDIKNHKYYLSCFPDINGNKPELFYIKNKSAFYQTLKTNKIINFSKFYGFGETIFISEFLFNSPLINIFNYKRSDEYISISNNLNVIKFPKSIPQHSRIIILDNNLKEYTLSYKEIEENIKDNTLYFKDKLVSALLVQGSSIIDSSFNDNFLDNYNDYKDINVVKNLLLSNYTFLLKQSYTNFLRKFIMNNFEEFFSVFYNDKILVNDNVINLDFSKYNLLIEHLLFNFNVEEKVAKRVLQKIILNKQEKLLIDTPIVLYNLLSSANSKQLINYFYNLVYNAELQDERDEKFTHIVINNLLNSNNLKGIDKHNLKIAMHYINGKYYLKKILERLNG